MAQGNLAHNYEGVLGGVEVVSDGFNKLIKVYNAGSAILNGKVVTVSFLGTSGLCPAVGAPATNAAAVTLVGVVNNGALLGQTGIAATDWGFVQVAGLVEADIAAGATAEAGIEVINAGVSFIENAAVLDINSCGVAKGADASGPSATSGKRNVILYGNRVAIAAA